MDKKITEEQCENHSIKNDIPVSDTPKKKYELSDSEKDRRRALIAKAREKLNQIREKEQKKQIPLEQKKISPPPTPRKTKIEPEHIEIPKQFNNIQHEQHQPLKSKKQPVHKKISIKYYGNPSQMEIDNDERILSANFKEDNELELKKQQKSEPIKSPDDDFETKKHLYLKKMLLGKF